jgi:2-keto-4-pentenoate hydratase/2-oxohepta-3-ene-1,7-dioic acid hydratase in catechol pathway
LRDFLVWEAHYLAASRTMIRRYLPRPVGWLVRGLEALGSRRVLKPKRHWYRAPIYYKGNPRSFVGPDEQIAWPAGVRDLDFELEIGFVLSHSVRDATLEQAESAIAAYTIFNDFTARDLQIAEMRSAMGPAKSKDFDTGNAMGPVLVTADEISDVGRLRCRVLVNGEEWISTTTGGMHWHPAEMIAYASRNETLYPGDFFATGTVAGCSGVELDRWLQPGDLLELEVERVGTLRNRIGPKPSPG